MAGFLDENAPSAAAEYTRYIDGDILGKILFKSFLINLLGLADKQIYVPIGRYGDVNGRSSLRADAQVGFDGKCLDAELKCARVNIANRTRGDTSENWAFGKLLATPQGADRQIYDFAFAVGVLALGLEDSGYWDYLKKLATHHSDAGREFKIDAVPHETAFLTRCGFFIIPYAEIRTNYFRITVSSIPTSNYQEYFAWGYQPDRCQRIWANCIEKVLGTKKSMHRSCPGKKRTKGNTPTGFRR